jgi:Na+/glutamate symporter
MELETIVVLVTMVVTFLCGLIAKKVSWFNNHLIPIQNIAVGLIVALIEWIVTKDFKVAIALSGIIAGGTYDVFHNLEKIVKGE